MTKETQERNVVDLSNAKAGQIAHFRCGGKAEISRKFSGINLGVESCVINYQSDGRYGGILSGSPFDIIRLEDPPFDWKDVKPGMAFLRHGEIFYYVAEHLYNKEMAVFACPESSPAVYDGLSKIYFERIPERDIEVKS